MRRLNRYVEERAPWQLRARTRRAPSELDGVLATLAEGLRVRTRRCSDPYMPAKTDRLLAALGARRPSLAGARLRRRRGQPSTARPAVPQA